jgi:hypothetical protein
MVTFISKKAVKKPPKKKNNQNRKFYYTFEDCGHNDKTLPSGKCFTCKYLEKHSEDMAKAVYK